MSMVQTPIAKMVQRNILIFESFLWHGDQPEKGQEIDTEHGEDAKEYKKALYFLFQVCENKKSIWIALNLGSL